MEIRIREAKPEDASAIARVHVDTWRTAYANILPDEFLAGLEYANSDAVWSAAMASDRPGASLLVAETAQGEVVGFAYGAPEREGDPIYRGEIFAIYVLQAYQRQGAGRRLFSTAARRLQQAGFDAFLLWVLKDNLPARRFYEALGGAYLREKPITIGTTDLIETAYGWRDIAEVAGEA